jgi:uncharacterized membrane protein YoaK (UPF0700 family)
MADVIGLFEYQVFTAHITGNIVLVFAVLALRQVPTASEYLAIPVFALAVALIWVILKSFGLGGRSLARLLLLIQLLLLAIALALNVASESNAATGVMALVIPMVVVSAIACQYVLVRLTIPGGASTAVMTFNTTDFVLSSLDMISPGVPLTKNPLKTLKKSGGVLLGFVAGCAAGTATGLWAGDWAWLSPVIVAALALSLC